MQQGRLCGPEKFNSNQNETSSIEFWQIELRRYTHARVDDPLLCNRQDVVGNPIQHQAGREEEEHHTEDERHEPHQLGLHGIWRRRVQGRLQQGGQCHDHRQDEVRIGCRQIMNPANPWCIAHFNRRQ